MQTVQSRIGPGINVSSPYDNNRYTTSAFASGEYLYVIYQNRFLFVHKIFISMVKV